MIVICELYFIEKVASKCIDSLQAVDLILIENSTFRKFLFQDKILCMPK